jgi:hypothetical protein
MTRRTLAGLIIATAVAAGTVLGAVGVADAMPRDPCQDHRNQVRTSAYRDLADAAAGNDDENLYLPAERAGEPVEPMDDPGDGLFVQC